MNSILDSTHLPGLPVCDDRFGRAMRFCTAAVTLAWIACSGLAQVPAESTAKESPEPELNVVESHEVRLGDHSIVYNRVETPVLKPRPEPRQTQIEAPRAPTAEELARIREWESKRNVSLFLSATVYDRDATYVRWSREDGEYIFWSSIDFHYFRGLTGFETLDRRYTILLGIGDESRRLVERWNALVESDPELRDFVVDLHMPVPPRRIADAQPARSAFAIMSSPETGIDPEAERAMVDLHRHYDANREQLVRDFESSEKARIAHEEWMKTHPPQPKDTTVNFAPVRSIHTDKRGAR